MKILQKRLVVLRWLTVAATLFVAEGARAGESSPQENVRLKKKSLGTTQPAYAFGNIYLAGQPSPRDMLLLKTMGIRTVISLRHAKELAWDERTAVELNGMDFVHVPFSGGQQLKFAIFDQVLTLLRDKKREPIVLHCASANRVGAIWYAYRVLENNLSPDAAMKEAQAVGLRTPVYLERAQEYVEAVQKKRAQAAPSTP